ncbi:MAG: YggT family protein [Pseudanabaenaceae cyanobacterium bins.68]|nr:YggT family protein [Pseudanabaenaceae cyanobacterium bins.68]
MNMNPENLSLLSLGLNLLIGSLILANVLRIVLTWYPQVALQKFPLVIIFGITEPLLSLIRRLVPPLAGVDIAPVIGVGIFSLIRELVLGQQGLLTMAISN